MGIPYTPGRFHRHGGHLTLRQPVRQGVQVGREGAKGPHRARVALGGHAGPNLVRANIQTRCPQPRAPSAWASPRRVGSSLLSPHRTCSPSRWPSPQTRTPPSHYPAQRGRGEAPSCHHFLLHRCPEPNSQAGSCSTIRNAKSYSGLHFHATNDVP